MQKECQNNRCQRCSKEDECIGIFNNILKTKGGRLTNERKSLLKIICNTNGHFQPEQVAEKLKNEGLKISLPTIYRNLSLLLKAGIIQRAEVRPGKQSGGTYYEHVWGRVHHDHLICSQCGHRVEFSYSAIDVLQDEVARQYGFKLEQHHLELIGTCPECRQRAESQQQGESNDTR